MTPGELGQWIALGVGSTLALGLLVLLGAFTYHIITHMDEM